MATPTRLATPAAAVAAPFAIAPGPSPAQATRGRLDPEADAMPHLVIADIGAGADATAGKSPEVRSTQGATTVVTALNEYGRDFDHAGWKPIMAGH